MRHKRPSVALDPAIAARAVELRAEGTARELSFRAVEAALEREGKKASIAAIHAAVASTRAKAATPTPTPDAAAPTFAEDDLDVVDVQERADELRAIAGEAAIEVREVTRFVRTRRAAGEVTLDDAAKLLAIAERAEKLARLLEGRGAAVRGAPPPKVEEPVRTGLESGVLAALRARRASATPQEPTAIAST